MREGSSCRSRHRRVAPRTSTWIAAECALPSRDGRAARCGVLWLCVLALSRGGVKLTKPPDPHVVQGIVSIHGVARCTGHHVTTVPGAMLQHDVQDVVCTRDVRSRHWSRSQHATVQPRTAPVAGAMEYRIEEHTRMRIDNRGALVEDESTHATSVRGVQQRRRRRAADFSHRWRGRRQRGDSPKRRGMPAERGLGQPAPAPSSLRSGRQHNRLCAVCSWSIALRATRPVRPVASSRAPPPGQLVSGDSQSSRKWCKRSGRYAAAAGVSVQGILLDCENVRPTMRRAVHRYWTSRSGLTARATMLAPWSNRDHRVVEDATMGQ